GYSLERRIHDKTQRVIVLGDGDFLSNTYIGNGGNLDLGINLLRWLSGDEGLLDIPSRVANDLLLQLSDTQGAIIGLGFLLILPVALFTAGGLVWWRRGRA
ncbi:MAG: ABC transporter, partial [Candidatus Sedimenticola endophacoides]